MEMTTPCEVRRRHARSSSRICALYGVRMATCLGGGGGVEGWEEGGGGRARARIRLRVRVRARDRVRAQVRAKDRVRAQVRLGAARREVGNRVAHRAEAP